MAARVDAAAGVVIDGDEAWPLRLDCRTGGAVVGRPGREIAVSPLRWRHKQHLARWAHLGPAFVAGQRAVLAVEPGTVLDPVEQAVVAAVAEFLDGGDALPCEPSLLAVVTAEACRATGLAPAAFDDRDAAEVEMIWRTAPTGPAHPPGPDGRGGASLARDPWADATSIVFTAPSERRSSEPPGPAAPEGPTTSVTSAMPAMPVIRDAAEDDAGAAAPAPEEAPAPAARRREAPCYRVAPARPPRPAGDRATTSAGEAMVPAPNWSVAAPGSSAARAPAPGAPDTASRPDPVSLSLPGSPADTARGSRSAMPWPAVPRSSLGPRPDGPAAGGAAVGPVSGPAHGPAPAAAADPRPPAPVTPLGDADLEDLVVVVTERLAEQFSRAAADLGVEV